MLVTKYLLLKNMKETLNKLINHDILSKDDAKQILVNIAKGEYNTSQIAAFSDGVYDA